MPRTLKVPAIAALDDGTRAQIDAALCTIVAGDTKFLDGGTLSNEESVEYLQAHQTLGVFSGEIVTQALQMLIRSQRGQRIFAKALPPSLIVNVNGAARADRAGLRARCRR